MVYSTHVIKKLLQACSAFHRSLLFISALKCLKGNLARPNEYILSISDIYSDKVVYGACRKIGTGFKTVQINIAKDREDPIK